MIAFRGNLGPLPSQFVRLEMWDNGVWVKEPPALIRCSTVLGFTSLSFSKGASYGKNCSVGTVLYTDTWTYTKAAKPDVSWPDPRDPDSPVGFNAELDSRIEEFDAFYEAAEGEVTRVRTLTPTGDGQITSENPLEAACGYTTTTTDPSGFDFWQHVSGGAPTARGSDTVGSQPFFSSALYVDYNMTSFVRTYLVRPAPAAPAPEMDADIGGFQVVGYTATLPDSIPDATSWPAPIPSGTYYRISTRERLEWVWSIVSDTIYSEEIWPKDSLGNPVTITGALRWKETTVRTPDGEDPEETVVYFSEPFSLDPGGTWDSSPKVLDERGEDGVTVTVTPKITNVLVRYPAVIFNDPDYSEFPYVDE